MHIAFYPAGVIIIIIIIITFIRVTRANQNMMYALGQTGPMSHYKI